MTFRVCWARDHTARCTARRSERLERHGCGCAVKCLRARYSSESRRWNQEVEIMRSLDHPNIVKLVESFQDRRNMHLVVELCTGGQLLSGVVTKGELFSEQKMAAVLQQILRGTLYLHSCWIAHRDLKPENLLLSSDAATKDTAVKIIDFGLARRFAAGEVLKTMVGSPVYVAPEVLNGKGYDSQCDIWSIGGTAFVLACGHVPFTGKTEKSVLDKVARGIPCFLPAHWRRVPAHAKAFVQTLLTKSPERRPTAALALADEWLTAAAGPGARGLPRGFVENLRRFKSEDTFSKAVRHVVAGVLDDPDVRALRSAFVALDLDGNGLLSPRELKEGLRRSGLSISEQELLEILEGMDVNGNGAIEYTEFLAAAVDTSKCRGEGMCQYAFDVFDWDGDGQISLQDLWVPGPRGGLEAEAGGAGGPGPRRGGPDPGLAGLRPRGGPRRVRLLRHRPGRGRPGGECQHGPLTLARCCLQCEELLRPPGARESGLVRSCSALSEGPAADGAHLPILLRGGDEPQAEPEHTDPKGCDGEAGQPGRRTGSRPWRLESSSSMRGSIVVASPRDESAPASARPCAPARGCSCPQPRRSCLSASRRPWARRQARGLSESPAGAGAEPPRQDEEAPEEAAPHAQRHRGVGHRHRRGRRPREAAPLSATE
ncbi:unnamed protein product [Prorocentrum cordatum]|uniref:Non-specific serine/threonine protein kinase n=1 Tax=Prorocentrum cordatum TaxID=2364126 RepID=A0ABN9TEN9_9DINO|nr:unnamed protein product [Polarella glacialis]